MLNLWHLTVNAVWKWSGLHAWSRTVRKMLDSAHHH